MRIAVPLLLIPALLSSPLPGQSLTDTEIQTAMTRGRTTPAKKLWEEIRKRQEIRINRAGFGDPIEKKALFLTDADRVALETAEAKRQLRELSVDDVKNHLSFGEIEVLLEANVYNNLYAGSLTKWGPSGGVHLVLRLGDKIVQPLDERLGPADAVSVLPQEHGVVTRQGNQVTYTPLYRSAIYERASERAWFTFPTPPPETKVFTVIVISGDGKQKEKEIPYPF